MVILIIGHGEVGRAHFKVLKDTPGFDVYYKDKGEDIFDKDHLKASINHKIDYMLVATQCDPSNMTEFKHMVYNYFNKFQPYHIDILTTTPCGTTEELEQEIPVPVTKSSIRGMHPHLEKFLIDIPKHIGGPDADKIARMYEQAGIDCVIHQKSRTIELCHILNNFIYGINILAADEAARYCRHYGVDYMEFVKYRQTQNDGFIRAGYPSKVSPILTPLNGGAVGGHCITYAPSTFPEGVRGDLAKMLYEYNTKRGYGIKVN